MVGGGAGLLGGLGPGVASKGPPKNQKEIGDPVVGGQGPKKDQDQIWVSDVFGGVFEIPSARNAEKFD